MIQNRLPRQICQLPRSNTYQLRWSNDTFYQPFLCLESTDRFQIWQLLINSFFAVAKRATPSSYVNSKVVLSSSWQLKLRVVHFNQAMHCNGFMVNILIFGRKFQVISSNFLKAFPGVFVVIYSVHHALCWAPRISCLWGQNRRGFGEKAHFHTTSWPEEEPRGKKTSKIWGSHWGTIKFPKESKE